MQGANDNLKPCASCGRSHWRRDTSDAGHVRDVCAACGHDRTGLLEIMLFLSAAAIIALITLVSVFKAEAAPQAASIYWSDGDSGKLNGEDFRLADVDAPETGGVDSRNGAECEAERALGFKAKEWVLNTTRGKTLTITRRQPADQYGRAVLDLTVDGKPLGELGIAAGIYRPWPFRNGRALIKKPNWCG